jgi:hypothetical protein
MKERVFLGILDYRGAKYPHYKSWLEDEQNPDHSCKNASE